MLLGLVLQHLYQAQAEGRASPIVLPVSYTTLNERKLSHEYFALCRQIELPARSRIVFEIYGLARDVPQLRLQELLSCLAPFSLHRIIRAFSIDPRALDFNRFRLAMVSVAARRSHHATDKSARTFDSFITAVHSSGGCKLLVRDINDEAAARWYGTRGADFLCYAGSAAAR